MENILTRKNREVLEQLAWSNLLVAFDYDGTLAPIVSDPGRAAMRPATRHLLGEVARRYPCIVISGRGQADIRRRLDGVGLDQYLGNHGVEPWQATGAFREEVERWRPIMEAAVKPHKGVWIEDKLYSLAIHYRRSREKRRARGAILRAAASLGPVRIMGGKQVVNILPAGAPDKGSALEIEIERFGCDTALYVGDDETDEDVFRLDQPGRLLTIRVGQRRSSLASYFIRAQAEIDRLLRVLVELRPRAMGHRQRAAQ